MGGGAVGLDDLSLLTQISEPKGKKDSVKFQNLIINNVGFKMKCKYCGKC